MLSSLARERAAAALLPPCWRGDNVEYVRCGAAEDGSATADEAVEVRYPGESMLATRRENLMNGIKVDEELWQQVLDM